MKRGGQRRQEKTQWMVGEKETGESVQLMGRDERRGAGVEGNRHERKGDEEGVESEGERLINVEKKRAKRGARMGDKKDIKVERWGKVYGKWEGQERERMGKGRGWGDGVEKEREDWLM